MELYFQNCQGNERLVAELEQSEEPEEKYHQITMDEYLESLQTDGE